MEWNLDQFGVLVEIKNSYMEMTSQLSPGKIEEMVKKAPNKIVDDKLHSEDVLQELKIKIISLL